MSVDSEPDGSPATLCLAPLSSSCSRCVVQPGDRRTVSDSSGHQRGVAVQDLRKAVVVLVDVHQLRLSFLSDVNTLVEGAKRISGSHVT